MSDAKYLTISKRFEISLSARQYRPDWDTVRNEATYGPYSRGEYGHGYNYVVVLVFHGPVDDKTGMMINVTIIKERARRILESRFDHKFLNRDTYPFDGIVPTAENVARQILTDITPLFDDQLAKPVACHVEDTSRSSATAHTDGRIERHHWLEFSAARRTHSPLLSEEENTQLFGIANRPDGHGHNYRLRVTLGGTFDTEAGVVTPYEQLRNALESVHSELDHRNLNTEVPGLVDLPITTESLARYIFGRLATNLPLLRARLYELPDFFAEHHSTGHTYLGVSDSFHAAHRLHSAALSDPDNLDIYAKCNNLEGHGHEYKVEATIGGEYDKRSGTLYDFVAFTDSLKRSLDPWAFKHLDRETEDFRTVPSTGENIIDRLWARLDPMLDRRLLRLRLWETPNNRFTLRRISDE